MEVDLFPKPTFPIFVVISTSDVPAECSALGYVILDFGGGATKVNDTQASMTGLPWINENSVVELWIQGTDETSENNAYSHMMAAQFVAVTCESISPGVGFLARGISNGEVTGKFKVRWAATWN